MSTEAVRLGPHTVQLRPDNGGKYPYGNPLLIEAGSQTVMIDSCLHTAPSRADLLLISHYHEDHAVDAPLCPGEVWAHELDVSAVRTEEAFATAMGMPPGEVSQVRTEFRWDPVPDARGFSHGEEFDLGGGVTVTALHLPGHTPGHCGFLIEPDGILYTGDIDLSSFGPLYSDQGARLTEFRASLSACADYEAAVYASGHHKGPYFDRSAFLSDLTAFSQVIDIREQKILDLVAAGRSTVTELVGQGVVYRPGKRPGFADRIEASVCGKHLDELVGRGILAAPDADGNYTPA